MNIGLASELSHRERARTFQNLIAGRQALESAADVIENALEGNHEVRKDGCKL